MKKSRIIALLALALAFCVGCFAFAACGDTAPSGGDGDGGEGGGGAQVVEYTVTFNLNYTGAAAATTAKVVSGQKATKPTDPTRQGYTFDGWFINAQGTGTAFDFNTAITADTTLYAKWSQQGGGGGGEGGGTTPANALPDNHQNTSEKDASWKRVDLYAASAAGSQTPASYVTIVNGNIPDYTYNWATRRADSNGYYPIGNTSGNTGLTITFNITSTANAEVGIYLETNERTTNTLLPEAGIKFSDVYSLKVNGANVTTNATMPIGTTNWGATNRYIFLGYANVTAGNNTVVVTCVDTAPSSGNDTRGYNIYALRFSAQTATIAAKTS